MRYSFVILLGFLLEVSCHAEISAKAEADNTIPPVIVEGKVEGVPDGTIVELMVRYKKSDGYLGGVSDKDTIVGGKFRIVHIPEDKDEEEFLISTPRKPFSLPFYASVGTVTKITGKGLDNEAWRVENDNELQKERNEYRSYIDENIPDYYDRRGIPYLKNPADYEEAQKESERLEYQYVTCMIQFLEKKEYNPVFAKVLAGISSRIHQFKFDSETRENAVKLLSKVPFNVSEENDGFIAYARQALEQPKYFPLRIGEEMHDFTLYDHNGKEHHLNEFNGNGKFLLIEFNSRTCVGCMEHRPMDFLNNVYKNHSDKVDMLMVNCDDPYFWEQECKDEKKWGRDPWHEWNDHKACKNIMQRYDVNGPTYYFISPDGVILGRISDQEDLKAAITKYFKI